MEIRILDEECYAWTRKVEVEAYFQVFQEGCVDMEPPHGAPPCTAEWNQLAGYPTIYSTQVLHALYWISSASKPPSFQSAPKDVSHFGHRSHVD